MTSHRIALAALAVDLSVAGDPPRDFRILPAGEFRAHDGRPTDCRAWRCDEADARRIVADLAARVRKSVIDYEHATLKAKKDAVKAPAAGWFDQAEWRADGLYLTGVEWTASAAREIAERAYRYVSPVFAYAPDSGRVLCLRHVALTNEPALDGLTDLAALAAEFFIPPMESCQMEFKKLLVALGLAESATEDEALTAIAALKNDVVALSARTIAPDPAKYAPVDALAAVQADNAALAGKIAALTAEIHGEKVDALLAKARGEGRCSPALEGWLRDIGTKNLADLSAYLEKAPIVVAPGETQSGGQGAAGIAALTAEQRTLMKIGGWDAKVFQPATKE
jgi:phage I-like protein